MTQVGLPDQSDLSNKRILLIGMADSVHLARWLQLFEGTNVSFVLMPSGPNRSVHPEIELIRQGRLPGVSLRLVPEFFSWAGFWITLIEVVTRNHLRGRVLRHIYSRESFDLIHVHELQHAGYIALAAFKKLRPTKLLLSNWGSDIYWFANFRHHRERLKSLLRLASHYSAECRRDVLMAQELGFDGQVLPVLPNFGGFRMSDFECSYPPPSKRKIIAIKGYTGFVGKATNALRAIRLIRHEIEHLEVVVYSASYKSIIYGTYLRYRYKIDIRFLRPGRPNAEIQELFRASRIYVGISMSDGISTSLLEAMLAGCFPIQSSTSCGSEWIKTDSGRLVDWQDITEISKAMKIALKDDELVDRSAVHNRTIIEKGASRNRIAECVLGYYSQIVR